MEADTQKKIRIELILTEEEHSLIKQHMIALGFKNRHRLLRACLKNPYNVEQYNYKRTLQYEANKIGVNLNQVAKHFNILNKSLHSIDPLTASEMEMAGISALISIDRGMTELLQAMKGVGK